MTTGEDRNKDRFENKALRSLKAPFSQPRSSIKLTQNCVTNPCINLHDPPSITREYHPNVLERLHLLLGISAHLQNTLPRAVVLSLSWFVAPFHRLSTLVVPCPSIGFCNITAELFSRGLCSCPPMGTEGPG